MSKRAAIYARVSTDDQRGNYSVPTQLAACREYVQARGYTLVGDQYVNLETGRDTQSGANAIPAFVDDLSSRELSRPSLDAALTYLENFGFDILVVHALDRLARDPYIRQTLEIELGKRDAKVEYVLGNYEETPEGEVRKDLDATFAKWENLKRVERSTRGKIGKAQRGLFVAGRAPFGYKIDGTAQGGLAVDEDQATIVRRIFHLYVEDDLSIRAIARLLTDEKVPSAQGGGGWGKSSVVKILRNQAYIGHAYYNKRQRNGKSLRLRDEGEWIEFATTPIVDEVVFAEAQRRLDLNGQIRKRAPSRFYLLSGMVFCAECDKPYVAQTLKAGKHRRVNDAPSYRHRVKEGHCINRQISARRLEPVVWGEIKRILLDPDSLRQGYEESLSQQEAAHARKQVHLESLRRGVMKIEQKRQNLNAAYIDPEIGMLKADYVAQKVQLNKELEGVLKEIDAVEDELSDLPTLAELETLEAFSAEIADSLGNGDLAPEERRKILQMLHVKVLVAIDGGMRLDGWFNVDGLSSITCS